jgi:methylglyoxal synthase
MAAPLRALGDQPFVRMSASGQGILTTYGLQVLLRLSDSISGPTGVATQIGTITNSTVLQQINIAGATAQATQTASALQVATQAAMAPPGGDRQAQAMLQQLQGALVALGARPERSQDIVTLHNGARLLDGYGSPEELVPGCLGDLFLRRDGAAGTAGYLKTTGAPFSPSGWVAIGSGAVSSPGLVPLVNGDLPGPGFVVTPDGQCIGVPAS